MRQPRPASPPSPCDARLFLVFAKWVPLPRRGRLWCPPTCAARCAATDATSFATRPYMRASGMLHTTANGRQHPRPSHLGRPGRWLRMLAAALLALAVLPLAQAEDGYELWLRYRPLEQAALERYRPALAQLVLPAGNETQRATRDELVRGLGGLLGQAPAVADVPSAAGAVLVGTPASLPRLAQLGLDLDGLGEEGYLIRSLDLDGRAATVVAANTDLGALYGSFHLLRLLQARQPIDALDLRQAPNVKLRVLNHWDDLNRHVERGYSGQSIWDWHRLPDWLDPRYTDYARANASIGINGTVVNNVNANAQILTPMYLDKVQALAGVMRPWGIKVYVSARFSAPMEIGGLATADPMDPAVRAWWRAKADEIYARIPDFGGFLVKANSEGQPGPQDFGRTHADGANMLAEAVAPHGGVVMWRAFVY